MLGVIAAAIRTSLIVKRGPITWSLQRTLRNAKDSGGYFAFFP
jgi:hypothetical protein